MKTVKRNLKWVANILSFLLLLQSCTVYHSYSSTVDEAIASNNRVKLNVENNNPYKFKKLQRMDGEVYGLVYNKSDLFDRLKSRNTLPTQKQTLSYVQVYENELDNIHLKNQTASTILSIVIPAVALGLIFIPVFNNPLDPYGTND